MKLETDWSALIALWLIVLALGAAVLILGFQVEASRAV